MPLPNFLIVGAAKAGTTSLSKYIDAHPDAFICTPSEPKYLTSTFLTFPHQGPGDAEIDADVVRSLSAYRELFSDAGSAKAIGEASADLLYYHERAIPVIQEVIGDPRIIILLRNPVQRSFSAYKFLVGLGRETLSFDEALAEEPRRLRENWEFIWAYRGASLYADAVAAYREAFSDVHVLLLDDVKNRPTQTLRSVYAFLGVKEALPVDAQTVHNKSRAPRSRRLARWRAAQSGSIATLLQVARTLVPNRVKQHVRARLDQWNAQGPSLNVLQRRRLSRFFHDDIQRLERTLDRDLSAWHS
jgi:hypothetical protein